MDKKIEGVGLALNAPLRYKLQTLSEALTPGQFENRLLSRKIKYPPRTN